MIDIHSHILPGIDDGIQTLPQSIQLGFEYQKEGINAVIATPHIKDGIYNVNREKILSAVEVINVEFALAGLNVDIFAGAEYYMDIRVLKDLENGSLVPLGHSNCVLLEFPSYNIPTYSNTIIDILVENGYVPVIAHPERCREIRKNPSVLTSIIAKGCRIQVDSRSLTGENGKSMLSLCHRFLKQGQIDFIGFDIHRVFALSKHIDLLRKNVEEIGGSSLAAFLDRDELFTESGNLQLKNR